MSGPDPERPEARFDLQEARVSAAVYARLAAVLLDLALLPGRLLLAVLGARSRRREALRMVQDAAARTRPSPPSDDRPGD